VSAEGGQGVRLISLSEIGACAENFIDAGILIALRGAFERDELPLACDLVINADRN
jgi:hypothetical protein